MGVNFMQWKILINAFKISKNHLKNTLHEKWIQNSATISLKESILLQMQKYNIDSNL